MTKQYDFVQPLLLFSEYRTVRFKNRYSSVADYSRPVLGCFAWMKSGLTDINRFMSMRFF